VRKGLAGNHSFGYNPILSAMVVDTNWADLKLHPFS